MDSKETISAANALIEWFNSQEVHPRDARSIMSKVIAKLMVTEFSSTRGNMSDILDSFTLQLAHDINDRSFQMRKRS